MRRAVRGAVCWAVAVAISLGCGDEQGSSASERWRATVTEAREVGLYCCTTNGTTTSEEPECSQLEPGSVYVEDFSDVDASGRGDACGWVLSP